MTRRRTILTMVAFLGTFGWLLLPEVKATPAVLWPSALAVGLAFVTRDIYVSLFLGAFSGALLLHAGNPWTAFQDLFNARLVPSLTDRWNISVLLFTLMIGGFVEVLNRNGGMIALTNRVMGRSADPRRAGLSAYFMGWLLFFDGLASALLVGKTLRNVADRAGLSREKLAFIVDSTSAPIAGLALLSTWVAYEMSVIRQGFENTGDAALAASTAPYSWLVLSLPFRFYNWFMLLLVFLVVWFMRDWGPMLRADRNANNGRVTREVEAKEPAASHILLALVPLGVLILGVFGGLYIGGDGLDHAFTLPNLIQALGKADAASVFVLATAVASGVALALSAIWRARTASPPGEPVTTAFFHGMQQMFLPAMILVFAWMLNSVIKELSTAQYLVSLLGDRLPAAVLPALVFVLSAIVSFSTGTSWGTMAIVMPLTIPLAVTLTGYQSGQPASPVLVATIGAVLAGAVFGDHCSPISDTTVVSAFSSECGVIAHVRTQLPYALAMAVIAVVCGYGPAGFGVSPVLLLPLGGVVCWTLVRYLGETRDDSPSRPRPSTP